MCVGVSSIRCERVGLFGLAGGGCVFLLIGGRSARCGGGVVRVASIVWSGSGCCGSCIIAIVLFCRKCRLFLYRYRVIV